MKRPAQDLSLEQLRVLVSVADHGSLSAAARELRRAQSSISYSISELEERLGVLLLDRSGYRPALTPQGLVVLAEARAVLANVDRLAAVASTMDTRRVEGRLRVAIDNLLLCDDLGRLFAPFAERFPPTQLVLRAESARTAVSLVREGECDLALHVLLGEVVAGLVHEPLGSIELVHVVAPGHPLSSHEGVIPLAVSRQHVQLVMSDRNPDAFKSKDLGVTGGPTWRFMDMSLRLSALRAGVGYGSLPWWMADPELRAGHLVRVTLELPLPPPLEIVATHRAPRALGPAARWVVQTFGAAVPLRERDTGGLRAKPRPSRGR
jgi:DNA-binding transcriptional LysR family regulator